uniref:hypothetical protein n=1 Tax=Daedaleopsis nitida TaxID=1140402 RepID=UPI0030E2BE01
MYLSNNFTECINLEYAEYILNEFFSNDITILVKCSFSNSEMNIRTIDGKMYIDLAYAYLGELFSDTKLGLLDKSRNTLFVFDEITWECLQILFNSFKIRLSGGSHSKRHLISPLDLRLLDCLELLRRYFLHIVGKASDLEFPSKDNFYVNYRELYEREISISYHQNDSLKTVEYKSSYKMFFKLYNLLEENKYNRKDFVEIFFLIQYKIWINYPYLFLIRKDEYKNMFSSIHSRVEQRIDELNKG